MSPSAPSTARPALRVGALAIASSKANAVGTVTLTCAPDGLAVDLLQVGRFAAGFAPLGLARPFSFQVPYAAVRGLVRVGSALHLNLDPEVVRPYNRFALCRFSTDPHEALFQAFRVRAWVRLLSVALPLPLAALACWLLPRAWVGGPVGMVAAGLVVAWLSWRMMRQIVTWLTWGGPSADRLREQFEQRLAGELGLEPVGVQGEELAARPEPVGAPGIGASPLGGAWATAARPRIFGVVATVGLVAALGAVLAVQRYGVTAVVVLPVDEARHGAAAPVRGLFESAIVEGSPRRPRCECTRGSSPLWDEGLPLLSILVAPRRGQWSAMWLEPGDTIQIEHPGLDPRHAPEVELDLAVVNNGAAPLETVSLVATFAQRTAQGRRHRIMERGLHWPARLRPGRSVKWRIEAEGTEVRIDCPLTEKLGTVPPASPETFHELREARLMPVRVHAAMMLAYLGDSRAAGAVRALGPLTALEERARTEIERALTPLRACGLTAASGILSACVHNGTRGLLRGVVVEGQGQGAPSWPVEDLFLPGRGLAVELPLGGSEPPERLRVTAVAAKPPPAGEGEIRGAPDRSGAEIIEGR